MNVPDKKILSALVSIQKHSEWKIIRDWLEDSKEENMESMVTLKEDIGLRWKQGNSQELVEILYYIDEAKDALDRFGENNESY